MMRFGRRAPQRVTQVFVSRRDEHGLYHREVHLDPDGSLVIEGHDLGPGSLGGAEYEFSRTIAPDDVARVRRLLGIDADGLLLTHLFDEFGATVDLERWLRDQGIEGEFTSHVG